MLLLLNTTNCAMSTYEKNPNTVQIGMNFSQVQTRTSVSILTESPGWGYVFNGTKQFIYMELPERFAASFFVFDEPDPNKRGFWINDGYTLVKIFNDKNEYYKFALNHKLANNEDKSKFANLLNENSKFTNLNNSQPLSLDINFTIDDKKKQCEAIGFKPTTEKFADCVLKLVELDVKTQQSILLTNAQNQGNQEIINQLKKQNNQIKSQYLIDLGTELLKPNSPASLPTTKDCTVYGKGSYRSVTCY